MSLVEQMADKLQRIEPVIGAIGAVVSRDYPLMGKSVPAASSGRYVVIDRAALRNAGYLPESSGSCSDRYRNSARSSVRCWPRHGKCRMDARRIRD